MLCNLARANQSAAGRKCRYCNDRHPSFPTIFEQMSDYVDCFACGAKALNLEGTCHEYMLAAPGCWMMFNEVMEKEYTDLRYAKAHQLTVDAYACTHVGREEEPRAVNSVNIHLASLYLLFEKQVQFAEAPKLRHQFAQYYKGKNELAWLESPSSFGGLSIFDIWDNEEATRHFDLVEQWARSVWSAWSAHHQRIARLVDQAGLLR